MKRIGASQAWLQARFPPGREFLVDVEHALGSGKPLCLAPFVATVVPAQSIQGRISATLWCPLSHYLGAVFPFSCETGLAGRESVVWDVAAHGIQGLEASEPPLWRCLQWCHLSRRGSLELTLGCSPPREAVAQVCGALRCGLGLRRSLLERQQRSRATSLSLLWLVFWTPAQLLLCRREYFPGDLPCQSLPHQKQLCPLLSAHGFICPWVLPLGFISQLGHVLNI